MFPLAHHAPVQHPDPLRLAIFLIHCGRYTEGRQRCGTGFRIGKNELGLAAGLLALENGAAAFDGGFGAAELAGDLSIGSRAYEFILGRRPFSKFQCGLIYPKGTALLPDSAEGASGELGIMVIAV